MSLSSPGSQLRDPHDQTSLGYMLKLSAPMIVSTVSFTVMQFIDRFMVSRLGDEALAAVLPAGFLAFVPGGFALGAMASLNTFVSQSLGRGRKEECANYFWQTIYMALAYCVLVVLVLNPNAPRIFRFMGQPEAIVDLEVIYLRILLYAHIVAVVNWSSNQFFMGIHRPIVTMFASLCGQAANIFANYVLIFGKFGFPRLEVAGAAWGTFVGISVAAVINMCIYLSPPMARAYNSRHIARVNLRRMLNLLRVGLPAGFGLMVNVALWGVVLASLVGRFGEQALAATSAVLSYTNLSVMPIVGVSMALTAAVGKAIGANRKDQAIKQTRICLRIAIAYMGFVGICFFVFRDRLMAFWSDDPRVVAIGARILICAAIYQGFHAVRVIYTGALRGAGDTIWIAGVSACGTLLVLGIGGSVLVRLVPSLGALGPWIAAAASVTAVGLANRWRFKTNRWMAIDLFKGEPPAVPIEDGHV